MRRIVALLALASIGCSSGLTAQPKPGDLLIEFTHDIGYIDRATGRLTTLYQGGIQIGSPQETVAGPWNRGVRTVLFAIPSGNVVVDIAADGKRTIVQPVSNELTRISALVADQDGSWLLTLDSRIHRVAGSPSIAGRLQIMNRITAMSRDDDTGLHYIASDVLRQRTEFHAFDSSRGVAWPLALTVPGYVTQIIHDHRTGNFWVAEQTAQGVELRLRDRSTGAVLSRITRPGGLGHVYVDDEASTLWVAGPTVLEELSLQGNVLNSWGPYAFGFARSVAIWGDRKLTGSGPCTPGSRYTVRLGFQGSPGASYRLALSWRGLRPGIPYAPGRVIAIAPDALFHATMTGALAPFLTGFQGRLDANGEATAQFTIPAFIPRGTLYTIAGVAVNPTRPGGLDVARSLTVAVR